LKNADGPVYTVRRRLFVCVCVPGQFFRRFVSPGFEPISRYKKTENISHF